MTVFIKLYILNLYSFLINFFKGDFIFTTSKDKTIKFFSTKMEHDNAEFLPQFSYSSDEVQNIIPLKENQILSYSMQSKYKLF